MDVVTMAKLTCPECGVEQEAEMPSDACQFFCECSSCVSTLRPQEGDCCVFCSYADTLCPPRQLEHAGDR